MADATKIEWADATFNPWWGCERVSPGCAHCYADTLATRYGFGETWGAGHGFRFFGDKHWSEPLRWARTLPGKLGRRPRVFCASMADVFEDRPELHEPRGRLFDLIDKTPELDWLVLTKRPEFARLWLRFMYTIDDEWTLPKNLWLGVSIENARFTYRADVLREIPAAVRFISAEPLLGSLFNDRRGAALSADAPDNAFVQPLDLTGIDWIIVGGESGPGARPFHLDHAREIIRAATIESVVRNEHGDGDSRVAVFVKQLGARPRTSVTRMVLNDRKGGDWSEWPADLRIREFPTHAGVSE